MKIVYSKPNCPGCVKLKAEYDRDGVEYTEVVIGKDIPVEDFFEKYPGIRTVPFVVEETSGWRKRGGGLPNDQ